MVSNLSQYVLLLILKLNSGCKSDQITSDYVLYQCKMLFFPLKLHTVHRVHGLKRHYLGRAGVGSLQQLLQVLAVIVAEDEPLGPAVPNALNHGRVVPGVGVDLTAWKTGEASLNLPPAQSDDQTG